MLEQNLKEKFDYQISKEGQLQIFRAIIYLRFVLLNACVRKPGRTPGAREGC